VVDQLAEQYAAAADHLAEAAEEVLAFTAFPKVVMAGRPPWEG
jgi:hypothetical protein